MDLTLPLYRQLFGRFFLLVLCFLFVSFASVGLYFFQSQQLLTLSNQQIPEFQQQNTRQALLVSHERLLNSIITSKNALEYRKSYKTLTENLKQLTKLSRKNRLLLNQLSQQLQLQVENVIRLNDSARRNIQLKDSVIIQLTLVADSLSVLIANQSQQQNDLYLQVNSDRLSDRVTANRAVALSNIVTNLNRNKELHRLLVDSLVMFGRLDLQYDLIEFDYLQKQASSGFEKWLLKAQQLGSKSAAETALQEQVIVLNNLLFVEQNTFAKWRGQLRRALAYKTELLSQKVELSPLLAKVTAVNSPNEVMLNQQLKHWLAAIGLDISEQNYIWFVAAIYSLLMVIFLLLLGSIRSKLKRFNTINKKLTTAYVETGTCTGETDCEETQQVIDAIKQIKQPKHSEADYLNLAKNQQLLSSFMSEHSEHLFWPFSDSAPMNAQILAKLFGGETHVGHWRHLFSRHDVNCIIASARKAKQTQSIQRLSLITLHENEISLSIEFANNSWRGSICSAKKLQQLISDNSQLQQQLQQQSQDEKLNIIKASEQVSKTIQRTALKNQLVELGKYESSGEQSLSLNQLLTWSQRQKVSAQLRRDDYLLTLSDVNIIDELHAVAANVMLAHAHCHNVVYVNTDANLNPSVTLESELFQSMVYELASLLLAKQNHATLDIKLQVIDVNSAQQIIRFSLLLSTPSCQEALVKSIKLLGLDTDSKQGNFTTLESYLRDLLLVFNASNNESIVINNSGKFTFDIPLASADTSGKTSVSANKKKAMLSKANILVVATDASMRERICQGLNSTKLNVETMRDLTLFQRQLSIKHLTANSIDVLIMSLEVYQTDYKLIAQHIASLPEKLQPKLLVTQGLTELGLATTGVYSACLAPWYEVELQRQLAVLLAGTEKCNLLIAREIFAQQRFLVNHVELLLAVAKPVENQLLIQLLHWLGFQVTLVSNVRQLESHWQTGRYLLLISEFLSADLTLTDAEKSPRGIFCFGEQQTVKEYINSQKIEQRWQADLMPPALDIQAIIKLLMPWLKPAFEAMDVSIETTDISEVTTEETSPPSMSNKKKLNKAIAKPTNSEIDELAELQSNTKHIAENDQQSASETWHFDLAAYAQNQGSAELAAIMLDDYLSDIEQFLLEFEVSIQKQDVVQALICIEHTIQLCEVIAAQPLLQLSKAVKAQLAQVSEKLSQQDIALFQQQAEQLQQSFSHLVGFAESI